MSSILESTISKILEYDSKSVAPFRSAANELAIHPDALAITLEIAQQDDPTLQTGGTWILKFLLENGIDQEHPLCEYILEQLDNSKSNDANLHLLQCLANINIPKQHEKRLYERAVEFTQSPQTFIRAWAYNALALVAEQNPDFRKETTKRFQSALKSDSPSIRVRIRNTQVYKIQML